MVSYIDNSAETDFVDLVEDVEFKKDLIRFFSGGRYSYTPEEMRKKGFDGLTSDFVEHMRGQSWNEVTAVKDLNYANNKDYKIEGKQAFGRLMEAWDTSDSVGSGFGDSVGDFAEAIATAPSTYLGFASFGLGKVGAKAATKAAQIGVRYGLKAALKPASAVVNAGAKRTILQEAKREAAIGAVTGLTVGGIQANAEGEAREETAEARIAGGEDLDINGYEYTGKDLIYDSLIGGTVEGTLGAAGGLASGLIGRKRTRSIDGILKERSAAFKVQAEEAAKRSVGTLNAATQEQRNEAMKIVGDLEDILSARKGNKRSSLSTALDPARVAKGKAIMRSMSDPKANPEFSSGLSTHTMRGVAAAVVDLQKELNLKSEGGMLRITEVISNKMTDEGSEEVFKILDAVKKKYGLSKEEFSMIYLAEVSRAGQTLGFMSSVARGGKLKEDSTIDKLFSSGASSMNSEDIKEISMAAVRNSNNEIRATKLGVPIGKAYNFLLDADALRVALMTSQPATTVRNMTSTGILIGADMSDQVFKSIFKAAKGDTTAIRNIVPDLTAIVRGMTVNKTEAELLRKIMLDEIPEQASRLYNDAMRLEVGMGSNSVLASVGRKVNILNTLSDTVLKEGIFYGDLDRQFRAQNLSLSDWLKSNTSLDDLPEGINLDAASKEANSMTMQDNFRDNNSGVGVATKWLVNLNRKVPFLVSTAMGIPFPRYMGNHLSKMSEYAPGFGELFHRTRAARGSEDGSTRFARQATGATMLLMGYTLAEERQGEVDYGTIKNTLLQEYGESADLKPLLGATMLHMYAGDLVWRIENDLPLPSGEALMSELGDVLGGIPEFSFELGLFTKPLEAFFLSEGGAGDAAVDAFKRELGDFVASYTMNPVTIGARDIVGQFDYDKAGSPYTPDLANEMELSMKGEAVSLQEAKNRASRNLPDVSFVQMGQSLNGETDIPYYDPFNGVARGKVNPLLKQITGVSTNPAPSAIEMDMSKYGIKGWQIYNNSTAGTANVDLILRKQLAKSLPQEFNQWKSNRDGRGTEKYAGLNWEQIKEDSSIPNQDKKQILEKFIKSRIADRKESITNMFESYVANDPVKARGYIRNTYQVFARQNGGEGSRNLNLAAERIAGMSAEEYLADSEDVSDEIQRRMRLLGLAETVAPLKPN